MRCSNPPPAPRSASALLLAAVRASARRFRLPALPADAAAARAQGAEAALAQAIESAREAEARGQAPAAGLRESFTGALSGAIREALRTPAHQALVLRAHDAEVAQHERLAATAARDRRAVMAAVDALAHPGKTRALPAGAQRARLEALHRLAAAREWAALHEAAQGVPAQGSARARLAAVAAMPELARLLHAAELSRAPGVQRYAALLAQARADARRHGASREALTDAEARAEGAHDALAAQDDRSLPDAPDAGARAEALAVHALTRIADALDRVAPAEGGPHRVLRGLLPPHGWPAAPRAKDEWDVVLLRPLADGAAHALLLLAEVKASPAAAANDLPRLRRSLRRLADASGGDAHAVHAFRCAGGEARITGASLQALAPAGDALPPQAVYLCPAAGEANVPWITAAAKAQLLAQPASLAFAQRIVQGEAPGHDALAPVWQALLATPRLRGVLHQWPIARAAREAMVHPDDLLAAFAEACGG